MFELLLQTNPGLIFIAAGILCALIPINPVRKALLLFAPIFAGFMIFHIYGTQEVTGGIVYVGSQKLVTLRIDSLSLVWGYIFCLAGVLRSRGRCFCRRFIDPVYFLGTCGDFVSDIGLEGRGRGLRGGDTLPRDPRALRCFAASGRRGLR